MGTYKRQFWNSFQTHNSVKKKWKEILEGMVTLVIKSKHLLGFHQPIRNFKINKLFNPKTQDLVSL